MSPQPLPWGVCALLRLGSDQGEPGRPRSDDTRRSHHVLSRSVSRPNSRRFSSRSTDTGCRVTPPSVPETAAPGGHEAAREAVGAVAARVVAQRVRWRRPATHPGTRCSARRGPWSTTAGRPKLPFRSRACAIHNKTMTRGIAGDSRSSVPSRARTRVMSGRRSLVTSLAFYPRWACWRGCQACR